MLCNAVVQYRAPSAQNNAKDRKDCECLLLNAHAHDGIVRVHHALEADSALVTAQAATAGRARRVAAAHAARVALRAAARPVAAGAAGTGTRAPLDIIALHGALHDGRVVHTHAGADGAPLEAHRVQVVIAAALVINTARNFCCRWRLRTSDSSLRLLVMSVSGATCLELAGVSQGNEPESFEIMGKRASPCRRLRSCPRTIREAQRAVAAEKLARHRQCCCTRRRCPRTTWISSSASVA